MASTRMGFHFSTSLKSAPPQTLIQHEATRTPQECVETILQFSRNPAISNTLEQRLLEFQAACQSPQRALERLVRFLESCYSKQTVLDTWIDQPESLDSLLRIFSIPDPQIDWLTIDPEALGSIPSIDTAIDVAIDVAIGPQDLASSDLKRQLEASVDDASAIDVLRRFYHRNLLRAVLARNNRKLHGRSFRAFVSHIAETVLGAVCDRVAPPSNSSEITIALVALRHFSSSMLTPNCQWPLVAIYEETKDSGRSQGQSPGRATPQQTAERLLERICDWIHRITDGSTDLCWPLAIESVPVFAKRINHSRSWVDALPSHATALHAPMLCVARCVGGNLSLGLRFIEESNANLLPPFRTEVDLEYLAGYFCRALDSLDHAASSTAAIDAILSLQEIGRLASRSRAGSAQGHIAQGHISQGYPDDFAQALDASLNDWLDREDSTNPPERVQSEVLIDQAKSWFEATFGTSTVGSPLAASILSGKDDAISKNTIGALAKFESGDNALRMLQELASEEITALSSRNCRYHFSKIVEPLLERIAATPSPDLTLRNIVSTAKSLGGKGVLWELFSSHSLLMELYTRLCSTSPYLVQILLSNPGMIDDLLDSLMLERIPDYAGFQAALETLCKGITDIEPVVLSFRNAMHLAIGVRDILGRENITEIHRALADVHEVCLRKLAQQAYRNVASKQPEPKKSDGSPVEYSILLIGKLASREPNYHSDISMLILYDSNLANHGMFFQQVAQRLIQTTNRITRFGRLFELKAWQLLGAKSSGFAWTLDQLLLSIELPDVQIEQRMNLYTARLIGDSPFAAIAESRIERFLQSQEWSKQHAFELVEWRRELERTATPENIKRGWGGTLDVEVLAHMFYAKHLHTPKHPWLRGTIERLEALRKNGVLSPQVALQLRDAYYFLRSVESGLRLMNTTLRHDLPKEPLELSKLAYVLQLPDREQLVESCEHYRQTIHDVAQRYYTQFRAQVVAAH